MSFANRFGKSLLAYSLENEVTEKDTIIDVVDSEDTDNVESAVAETENSGSEVIEVISSMDEGSTDADTLEEVADVLEETEQDGGADPVTARAAEIAVESIYRRLNIQASPMGVSSLEAFGDKATRVDATRQSVESIRETANKIKEAVVALWNRIYTAIVTFFENLFVATNRTLARAKKLRAAADSVPDKATSPTISGGFVGRLSEGPTFSKEAAIKSAGKIAAYTKQVMTYINKMDGINQADPATAVNDASVFDSFSVPSLGEMGVLPDQPKRLFGLRDDESTVWTKVFSEPFGSNFVAVRIPNKDIAKGEEALKAVSKSEVKLLPVSKETPPADTKVPALNKKEAIKVLDGVIAGMEAFIKSKQDTKKLVDAIKETAAKVKKIGAKSDDKEAAARSRTVAAAWRGLAALAAGVSTQATKQAVLVAGAELDYVQKSLKAVGGKGEEEDK